MPFAEILVDVNFQYLFGALHYSNAWDMPPLLQVRKFFRRDYEFRFPLFPYYGYVPLDTIYTSRDIMFNLYKFYQLGNSSHHLSIDFIIAT